MTDKIESTIEFWMRRCQKFQYDIELLKTREKKLREHILLKCICDIHGSEYECSDCKFLRSIGMKGKTK